MPQGCVLDLNLSLHLSPSLLLSFSLSLSPHPSPALSRKFPKMTSSSIMASNITVSVLVTLKSAHLSFTFPMKSMLPQLTVNSLSPCGYLVGVSNYHGSNRSLLFSVPKPVPLSIPHLSKKHHYRSSGSTPWSRGYLTVASARNSPQAVSCWLISGLALIMQISTTISLPQGNLPESTPSKITARSVCIGL